MARPSKYKSQHCAALIEHMKGGLSFESFAGTIGVHRDTLYEWRDKHREFSDAKKLGDSLSLLWWEKLGKAAMVGEPIVTPDGRRVSFENFNTTMWIFAMKNRHGWRDRQEVDMKATVKTNSITIHEPGKTILRTEVIPKKDGLS